LRGALRCGKEQPIRVPWPIAASIFARGDLRLLALGVDILATLDDIPEIEQTALSLAWIRTMVNLLPAIGIVLSMDAISDSINLTARYVRRLLRNRKPASITGD
jgi:hypothetical protein